MLIPQGSPAEKMGQNRIVFHFAQPDKSWSVDKYMVRHFVKPGITGLAQVSGFRGETKEIELMEKRIRSDIYYVENWSLKLDLKIIFKTMYVILKGDEKAY